ncbi:ABC transporter substrate-binding protein [Microbacterium terrisoli]|uniref:ABC transporter substrate-binding protein n=1 Tax=Microbacterium terrisoli TaxID=3242192 RepID=UPI002803D33B|nr:ABC transporter substrate-binding protein [Microbacterium protaetiae]
MKSKTLHALAALATVSVTVLALAGCSGGGGTSPSGNAGGVIKIGAVMPLTGPLAALGTGDKEAAEQTVADINKAGGIDGKKIELTVADDKTDPTESVKQFNQMAADKSYSAMLASSMTSAAAAVSSSILQYKIPTIALSPVDQYVDGSNAYAFTSPGSTKIYAAALVNYWKTQDVKNVAVAYTGTDLYGQTGAASTKQLAEAAGMKIVLSEAYDPAATDFTPLITKVVAAHPDAFVQWGSGPAPVIITKQIAGKGVPFYVTGSQASNLWLQPSGAAAEGVIGATTAALDPDALPAGAYKDLVEAVATPWRAANKNVNPPEFAYGGATAIQLLKNAIEKAGSTDRGKIRDALEQTDLLTPNGHYHYSKTDHMGLDASAIGIMIVKDGVWKATDWQIDKFKTDAPK